MQLGNFKRLMSSDFLEEEQELVDKLALTINNGFESLYLALSKRLSFADNIQSTTKDITVIVDGDGVPTNSAGFQLEDKTMKITGCIVLSCENLDAPGTYSAYAPYVYWTQNGNGLKINNIAGLLSGYKYKIRLLVI